MLKWPALIFIFMAFMAAQAAFFSSLPAPFNEIDIFLIAMIGLVTSFRPRQAFAAAVSGGLARDLVTSAPVGTHIIIAVLVALLLTLLFERVITDLSLISFSALNAVGFIIYRLLAAMTAASGETAAGGFFGPGWTGAAVSWFAGLAIQIAAGLVLLICARMTGHYLRARFLFAEHA